MNWDGLRERLAGWLAAALASDDFGLAESVARVAFLLGHPRLEQTAAKLLLDELELAERERTGAEAAPDLAVIRRAIQDLEAVLRDALPGDVFEHALGYAAKRPRGAAPAV